MCSSSTRAGRNRRRPLPPSPLGARTGRRVAARGTSARARGYCDGEDRLLPASYVSGQSAAAELVTAGRPAGGGSIGFSRGGRRMPVAARGAAEERGLARPRGRRIGSSDHGRVGAAFDMASCPFSTIIVINAPRGECGRFVSCGVPFPRRGVCAVKGSGLVCNVVWRPEREGSGQCKARVPSTYGEDRGVEGRVVGGVLALTSVVYCCCIRDYGRPLGWTLTDLGTHGGDALACTMPSRICGLVRLRFRPLSSESWGSSFSWYAIPRKPITYSISDSRCQQLNS